MGVKVFYGVSVDGRGSDIICPTLKTLKYTLSPSISSPTETRRSHEHPNLSSSSGHYSNPAVVNVPSSAPVKAVPRPPLLVKTEKFPGMDFDAYWAYFKEDMTRMEKIFHLCMKDGWSWWMIVSSPGKSLPANMMDMITYILDNVDAGIDERLVPCMDKLAAMFGCTHERIVSIGFTVRSESVATLPSFPHLSPKASETRNVLGHCSQVPCSRKSPLTIPGDTASSKNTMVPFSELYFARKSISYRQTAIAGPGWFAMGNASGFTSPLFSPGINCIALSTSLPCCVDEYQYRMGEIQIPGLRMVDRFLYSMFRDVRLFHLFPLTLRMGLERLVRIISSTFRRVEIHWSLGSTAPVFQKMAPEVTPSPDRRSPSEPVSDETIAQVAIMCEGYRKMAVDLYSRHTQYSRYMRFMGDDLKPCPGKIGRFPGDFGGRRCTSCKHGNTQDRVECISCGSDSPTHDSSTEGSCKKEVLEAYERAKEREGRVTPDSAVMVEEQLKREMNGIQGAQVSAAA
ncbi:hypothetical protein BC829DRAFT_400191 [Chytridium lagenaria]|nr:hypothetical protein BC829DRAFT_400191 [Chytridium lagenaria]